MPPLYLGFFDKCLASEVGPEKNKINYWVKCYVLMVWQ